MTVKISCSTLTFLQLETTGQPAKPESKHRNNRTHKPRMEWFRIALWYLVLSGRNQAVSENAEQTFLFSALYEMVPHNVTLHDSRRQLNDFTDRVVFYALGDTPYGAAQKQRFPAQIRALGARSEFVVHLGDMMVRNPNQCVNDEYQQVATMLQESVSPVLIVPGDNDWAECNNSTEAYLLWGKHFHQFEQRWITNTLQVRHQEHRPENFAFTHKGVHFVGLHVLDKGFREYPSLNGIVQDDMDWLRGEQSSIYDQNVGAVVLFAHTFPRSSHPKLAPLNKLLQMTVIAADKPFIFIQGNLHKFTVSNPYPELNNFILVSVDMGRNADPMEVTVDVGSRAPFKLKRRPSRRAS